MKNKDDNSRKEMFAQALQGRKIPILTLDNKWYKLLTKEARAKVVNLEEQLNVLLKRQGKLNAEVKEIKKLKKKLMSEIVSLADEAEQSSDGENAQKMEQNKNLVEDCNGRLEEHEDELMELPREIEQLNIQLMLITMECCYEIMQENAEEIQKVTDWVTDIRIELKKRLIKKQEMEQRNNAIYSYMHDLFGAEVLELFDMEHDPEDGTNSPQSDT